MCPRTFSFITEIARRIPSRSLAAPPNAGGPCGRCCRNGKSNRRTVNRGAPASTLERAVSNFDWQLAPAPCVSRNASPLGSAGSCRNPRTAGSALSSAKEVAISTQRYLALTRTGNTEDQAPSVKHQPRIQRDLPFLGQAACESQREVTWPLLLILLDAGIL